MSLCRTSYLCWEFAGMRFCSTEPDFAVNLGVLSRVCLAIIAVRSSANSLLRAKLPFPDFYDACALLPETIGGHERCLAIQCATMRV